MIMFGVESVFVGVELKIANKVEQRGSICSWERCEAVMNNGVWGCQIDFCVGNFVQVKNEGNGVNEDEG